MSNIKVNRDLVLSIVKQDKKKFVRNIEKLVNSLVAQSVDALSKKVSYINLKNVTLQPVNELLNNSFVDNSKCIYLLGIENAQLELNTTKKLNFWRNLKERFKFAWSNRKLFKRRRKSRRRKKKELESMDLNNLKFDPSKYSIYNLAEDMQTSFCSFLSETSLVSLKDSRLQIFGRDDFGATTEIIIYLVSYSEECFKYFSANKRGYTKININSRIEHVSKKLKETGDNFTKILKIFNTLYFNINGHMPNQVYIESVLCFVPSELFQGEDIYKVYVKIVNYLRIKSIRYIRSINDINKLISEDKVCGNSGIEFNKMLNSI